MTSFSMVLSLSTIYYGALQNLSGDAGTAGTICEKNHINMEMAKNKPIRVVSRVLEQAYHRPASCLGPMLLHKMPI
jgi:hypothetical protein